MLLLTVIAGYFAFLVLFVLAWSLLLSGPRPTKVEELQNLSEDLDDFVRAFNGWPETTDEDLERLDASLKAEDGFEEWVENFEWDHSTDLELNRWRAPRAEVTFDSRWPK